MFGQFVNNLAPGNFGAPGIYVYNAPPQQVTPTGPALGKLGGVGTGQWGAIGLPTLCRTNADVFAAFGPSTALTCSITRDALAAMPECNQFVGTRIGDGNQAASSIAMLDTAAVSVIGLAAVSTGTLPLGLNSLGNAVNPAQASFTIAAGQLTAGGTVVPKVNLAITFPNAPTETFNGIVAGTAAAGYVAATFKANVLAAVNVGSALGPPSKRWTATAGSSVIAPVISTPSALAAFSATGGNDGATFAGGMSAIQSALLGSDGLTGRTGMYSLRGAINGGQFIFCGYSMQSTGDALPQAAVAFNNSEGVRCGFSFALGTQTSTAQSQKAANSASDPTLDVFIDWVQQPDTWTAQPLYVAPHAKGMGIISSLDYNQAPLNKPSIGASNVVQTERYLGGINLVSGGEAASRYASGINYLTKPSGVWALASDLASDGLTMVSDARAAWFFGLAWMQIAAPYLGQPQTNSNADPTRTRLKGSFNAFMTQQFYPNPKIGATANNQPAYSVVCDTTNNTPTTVAQRILNANVAVQTQSNAAIILVQSQVGVSVQLVNPAN